MFDNTVIGQIVNSQHFINKYSTQSLFRMTNKIPASQINVSIRICLKDKLIGITLEKSRMGNKNSTSNPSQEDFDLLATQTGKSVEEIKEIYGDFVSDFPDGKISKEDFLKNFPVSFFLLWHKLRIASS